MPDEKKPISKNSTVTLGLFIIALSAAIFIGTTIQKVNANVTGVKENSDKIENLVTKDDLKAMENNLIRLFSK